jgi:hypothetical protein
MHGTNNAYMLCYTRCTGQGADPDEDEACMGVACNSGVYDI